MYPFVGNLLPVRCVGDDGDDESDACAELVWLSTTNIDAINALVTMAGGYCCELNLFILLLLLLLLTSNSVASSLLLLAGVSLLRRRIFVFVPVALTVKLASLSLVCRPNLLRLCSAIVLLRLRPDCIYHNFRLVFFFFFFLRLLIT